MTQKKYAAFLRGVNVSGHKSVKMDELKNFFESLGFENVKTVLNSGNVIFETGKTSNNKLTDNIESGLLKKLNLKTGVTVRDFETLELFAESGPFRNVVITPQTRLYVTFLKNKNLPKKTLSAKTNADDFKILKITDTEIFSVINLSEKAGTVDFMKFLEKEFGSEITTRNWNTIVRMLKC